MLPCVSNSKFRTHSEHVSIFFQQLQSSTFCHGCGPSVVPRFGRVDLESSGVGGGDTDTGAVVRVTCDVGHKLRRGSLRRKCLVSGEWSADDPHCESTCRTRGRLMTRMML